ADRHGPLRRPDPDGAAQTHPQRRPAARALAQRGSAAGPGAYLHEVPVEGGGRQVRLGQGGGRGPHGIPQVAVASAAWSAPAATYGTEREVEHGTATAVRGVGAENPALRGTLSGEVGHGGSPRPWGDRGGGHGAGRQPG